jgi:hypothetical protein
LVVVFVVVGAVLGDATMTNLLLESDEKGQQPAI